MATDQPVTLKMLEVLLKRAVDQRLKTGETSAPALKAFLKEVTAFRKKSSTARLRLPYGYDE